MKVTVDNYLEAHYIHKSNWLRAAVLGANDGIISIASLAVSVAAANTSKEGVLLATLAGLVAGAFSMAAGEYVSVSSQKDIEQADIEREKRELEEAPDLELRILAHIYEERGLKPETAMQVAKELTEKSAIDAHLRDELGIHELNEVRPLQAAFASGAAFTVGGLLPLLVVLICPHDFLAYALYIATIFFLMLLGAVSAKTGGSGIAKAVVRVSIWGSIAMGASALIGYLFGVSV